jgi:Zn-dependent peptidase ImmA (M78 family)
MKKITEDEIRQCMALLHEDYKDPKCKINFMFTLWDFIKWNIKNSKFCFKDTIEARRGDAGAVYHMDLEEINVYLFNYKQNERFYKITMIFRTFHELRHHYQNKYKNHLLTKEVRYVLSDYRYDSSPSERDANRFASRMMMKNRKEISDILNVFPDWDITY